MKRFGNKGSATVWAVVICLAIVFMLCVVSEYMRISIVTTGLRDAVQSAVVSTVTANYDETYSQLREGYSGGYLYSDTGFIESIDVGDIYGRLDNLLGLTQEGKKYVKYTASGQREYTISDLRIEFENTALAQGNADKNLYATVWIYITIPIRYGGRELLPLNLTLQTQAAYVPKF